MTYGVGKKILWVDDKPEELSEHFVALEARGFVVTTATSPSEGYLLMMKASFDVIVLDLDFPNNSDNPQELLIKTKELCPDSGIIVVSGWLEIDDFRRGIERSRVNPIVLTKPLPEAESDKFLKTFIRASGGRRNTVEQRMVTSNNSLDTSLKKPESNRPVDKWITKGNMIAISAVIVAGVGIWVSILIYVQQRCDSAKVDALEYHTKYRDSTTKAIEKSLSSKFTDAAKACGPSHDLWFILDDWHQMPGRCTGSMPRGVETCNQTIKTLELLKSD